MHDILPQSQQAAILAEVARLSTLAPPRTNSDRIYISAQACVGRMVCPFQDLDFGNLACAFAVNRCVQFALGAPIDDALDTRSIYSDLLHGRGQTTEAAPGAIIVSPTLYQTTGTVHGHVGIIGEDGAIFSNSSAPATVGHWMQNYTVASWQADLQTRRGLRTYIFNVI